jgi:hypothetical protein
MRDQGTGAAAVLHSTAAAHAAIAHIIAAATHSQEKGIGFQIDRFVNRSPALT